MKNIYIIIFNTKHTKQYMKIDRFMCKQFIKKNNIGPLNLL